MLINMMTVNPYDQTHNTKVLIADEEEALDR